MKIKTKERQAKLLATTGVLVSHSVTDNFLLTRIEQKELKNGKMLNQNELYKIGQEFYESWDASKYYIPITYTPNFDTIDKDWIVERMNKYFLKQSDLSKQLAVDKGDLSSFLSGRKSMPKSFKVKAFYYFLIFELNQDFRDVFENMKPK